MAEKILVVDDEDAIVEFVEMSLLKEGFEVIKASSGPEALELVRRESPNLILLDVMMPGMDGFSVCRELRNFTQVPVIMLTALDSDVDKITGLETGADDYVVKPFNPKELIARIKAILRRTAALHTENISNITFKNINIDLMRRKVFIDTRAVEFTPREYNLFLFLVSNRDKIFAREELLREVWGSEFLDVRSVDVHIKYIREKLKEPTSSYIQTIWGKGYKFSEARGPQS